MPQPWLVGVKRRTLEDIKAHLGLQQIFNLINAKTWPYKTDMENLHRRDLCLMALLFLTAGRISEVLSLTKEQFDFQADPNFTIIRNMLIFAKKKLARNLNNPRLLQIHFHTFRHWKATMEYHKTKDILHVKEFLRHRDIKNTMIYVHMEKALFQKTTTSFTSRRPKH
jgi:integrase